MKKLIVFIQGESIDNVSLGDAKPASTDKLKYSTYGAKNYKSVCDTSLQGTMLTYENLDAGLELGLATTVEDMHQRGNPVHSATLAALDELRGKQR